MSGGVWTEVTDDTCVNTSRDEMIAGTPSDDDAGAPVLNNININ